MNDEHEPARDSDSGRQQRATELAGVSLFGVLEPDELQRLAELAVEVTYHTGDTVCREGEEGDTFFVVISGELDVWGGPEGDRVINRLGPGEVLGEMALLTGSKRAATVTVARSARLLAFNKAVFDRHLLPNPRVLEAFSRLLCRRLATMTRGEVVARTTTAIGVTGEPGLKGKSLVASALAALLAQHVERDTVLVLAERAAGSTRRGSAVSLAELARGAPGGIMSTLRREGAATAILPVALSVAGDEHSQVENLTTLVTMLGKHFPFVVLDLGAESGLLDRTVARVSDVVIRLVDAWSPEAARPDRQSQRTFQVIDLYNNCSRQIPINHCEPFVIPDSVALRDLDPAAIAAHVRDHPWSSVSRPLHRLARKILGASVGLAVGGGAAFGIAHVGVLKALEDGGIPVDLVTGSSMGSIVALGYATGMRPSDMIDFANRAGTKWTTLSALLDFSFVRPALLTGDRLVQIFSPLSGPIRTFEQLHVPCRTVATDIETGERVTIGSGSLEVAFRASSAVPMLWAPVKVEGRVLVDGGVSDPVPAQVVHEMGADICIAVNAVPALKKGVDTVLSRLYRRINAFNLFSYLKESQGLPSMFDLVMNTMQTLQHELGNFKAISADVRINPDLSAHTWIEFYRPQELIARGVEAAERALPDIKRLLADRMRRAAPDHPCAAAEPNAAGEAEGRGRPPQAADRRLE
jgi:NTE family protein